MYTNDRSVRRRITLAALAAAATIGWHVAQSADGTPSISQLPEVRNNPPAPQPEPVVVGELPLPPTAPSPDEGSCTTAINPHRTGCIAAYDNGIFEGPSYTWDGRHVLMPVEFAGAPAAPDPASVYSGQQVIAIKTDGQLFPSGDSWKCITCGVSAQHRRGANITRGPGAGYISGSSGRGALGAGGPTNIAVDHPQPFLDGRRMIAGTNVVDCGRYRLVDAACTADRVHVYPIRWNMSADGSGVGGSMRELRLHPDSVHLGWSHLVLGGPSIDEFAGMGRLVFNPAPRTGTPLVPRYELQNVTLLLNTAPEYRFFMPDPDNPGYLLHNQPRGAIGEFRGWSNDGKWAFGNFWEESGNVDLYMTRLTTGESLRVTRDPAYTDPMKMSPDDEWNVVMDNRQGGRHMWYAAMRGIPPLMDLLTASVPTSSWRNANRRFFQPFLIDRYGDRGDYHGQQLNAGPATPGSVSDPNWNGRADPAWSPDGTSVVYWQALVTAPACGGGNPLPCPESTEPGGRRTRLMIAHLSSRKPLSWKPISPVSDAVPWGIVYRPGDPLPVRAPVQPGKYILKGRASGSAAVEIRETADNTAITFVSAHYYNFSDDGCHFIDGTESAEQAGSGMRSQVVWHSNLNASGLQNGTKVTSEPGGLRLSGAGHATEGTLTTTINGRIYTAPPPGT
jgi:hypothetical protein